MSCVFSNNSLLLNRNQSYKDSSPEVLASPKKPRLNNFLRDFQQPLTVISATAQLAQLRQLDEESQEDFLVIAEAIEKLRTMITQMREVINSTAISHPQN